MLKTCSTKYIIDILMTHLCQLGNQLITVVNE